MAKKKKTRKKNTRTTGASATAQVAKTGAGATAQVAVRRQRRLYAALALSAAAVLVIGWFTLSSRSDVFSHSASAVVNNVKEDAPILGDPQAPVTIVEYADFQCPFCNRFFHDAEPQIAKAYIRTGKVKLVYKDFQYLGPDSRRAGEAAQCANAQGKFWEYHDALYNYIWDHYYAQGINGENAGAFTKRNLRGLATQIGLDISQFRTCVDSGTYGKVVSGRKNEGSRQGVRGTPTFFINGQKIVGAQPFSVFAQIIEIKLQQIQK